MLLMGSHKLLASGYVCSLFFLFVIYTENCLTSLVAVLTIHYLADWNQRGTWKRGPFAELLTS